MINVPIYRDVNIYKICGGDNEEDFKELNSPFYRILTSQSKLTYKDEDIRLCIIDETFLKFVEVNELEINKNKYKVYPVYYPVGNGIFNIDKSIDDIKWIIDMEIKEEVKK